MNVFHAMDNGFKRACLVWHRRSGKDKTLFNLMVKKAYERLGNYYYYFPTMAQGRKVLWQGRDRDSFPFLDHIPPEIIKKKSDQEMRIEFINGSAIQIVGTDRAEVVGPNPVGCVFSEYSLQDPRAWGFVRPILAENNGWAVFNYTPRGINHGHELYHMALENPKWFDELLTVDDTHAISQEALQDELDAGMTKELYQQEFYCSWDYGLEGAYYLRQMAKARDEDRICNIPVEDMLVYTAWDLGIGDYMAIWFIQIVGHEIRLIDYYQNCGEGLSHYAHVLQSKGYTYGQHLAPFDIEVRELGTGQSRLERAKELGIDFTVVEKLPVDDGIQAVRSMFPKCWFDDIRTKEGRNALMNYQKSFNEKLNIFSDKPLHNWASHGADAFRHLAVGLGELGNEYTPPDIAYPKTVSQGGGWML
jgi:hypothetical protein